MLVQVFANAGFNPPEYFGVVNGLTVAVGNVEDVFNSLAQGRDPCGMDTDTKFREGTADKCQQTRPVRCNDFDSRLWLLGGLGHINLGQNLEVLQCA